uniref:Uncharacterized protein n=1 Tax=Candidatus Kentrum eta TaxID=2126337 RepID=A0A450VKM2_9GAMM|nr:MAG: hypothetical protein BECKH772B_GA0070898_102448 [Candidatus Kentron sp. H]VFK02163.1 MAG: hypothetical protein BECKH772A_GA0070896_102566 [Candidatus Kentron sp. H]VFK05338.1 MAG: hypothetical protein BECKH772C_GA0070978_102607 [Candidatus Kentron sp. H]
METLDAYRRYLREALNHSHDALARDAEAGGDFLAIPPAIAGSILDAEASNPGIRELLDGLRAKYSSDPALALEGEDFEAMASNIMSGGVLSAWEECRAKNAAREDAKEEAKDNDEFVHRINGAQNEIFSVTFTWLPGVQTDLPLLQVAGLTVTGGAAHIPARIKQGTVFHRHTGYTQSFKWTDPRQDISIRLDFQGHPGTEVVVPALRPRNIIPVGTVIQSMLKWEDYVKAVNDEPEYEPDANEPNTSQWAPCDGRDIEGSGLAGLWPGHTLALDLRRVFLRGAEPIH